MIWKILGSLLLLKVGLRLVEFIWLIIRLYILPVLGIKNDLKKYGSWAVVTGATDGIGKAIARELAKYGLNIVLISRTEEKLKAVADEFAPLNVEIRTIQYDFSKNDGYGDIKEKLKDIDIGILVNNVGTSDFPLYFLEMKPESYRKLLNVNVVSVLEMSRIVMEGMIERKKGGLIVHVSSATSIFPTPLLSIYAATKRFLNMFSQGLSHEYKKLGIKHHVILPFFVATNINTLKPNGIFLPSPEIYARQMVRSFGITKISHGYWPHELQMFILSSLPEWVYINSLVPLLKGGRRKMLQTIKQEKD